MYDLCGSIRFREKKTFFFFFGRGKSNLGVTSLSGHEKVQTRVEQKLEPVVAAKKEQKWIQKLLLQKPQMPILKLHLLCRSHEAK
jgi:hypothetical protein